MRIFKLNSIWKPACILAFCTLLIFAAGSHNFCYAGPGSMPYGPVVDNGGVSGISGQTVLTSEGTVSAAGLTRSQGSGLVKACGSIDQPRTDNTDLSPELSGGEIRFLKNGAGEQQELCAVIRSSDGKVIVVDGGVEADADHLYRTLMELGGTVNAWFITHPHSDHVGGLYAILKDHKDVNIENIYGSFFEYDWYAQVDPGEVGMLWVLYDELGKLPQEKVHYGIKRNDVIRLSDNLSVRVMNDIKKSEGNFAVNSSGLMYDITVNGKHLIILGDMGETVGNINYAEGVIENLVCDYLQTAHHGQNGVGEVFYRVCNPKNVIWNTTKKIFNNENATYRTNEVKKWFSNLSIENHYSTVAGDVIIR